MSEKEETAGSSIWARAKQTELRNMRRRADAELAGIGTPKEQRTPRELDRYLESRNRSTIDRWKHG